MTFESGSSLITLTVWRPRRTAAEQTLQTEASRERFSNTTSLAGFKLGDTSPGGSSLVLNVDDPIFSISNDFSISASGAAGVYPEMIGSTIIHVCVSVLLK